MYFMECKQKEKQCKPLHCLDSLFTTGACLVSGVVSLGESKAFTGVTIQHSNDDVELVPQLLQLLLLARVLQLNLPKAQAFTTLMTSRQQEAIDCCFLWYAPSLLARLAGAGAVGRRREQRLRGVARVVPHRWRYIKAR